MIKQIDYKIDAFIAAVALTKLAMQPISDEEFKELQAHARKALKQELLDYLLSKMPERKKHDGSEEDWTQRHGFNVAIDEVEAILREELTP